MKTSLTGNKRNILLTLMLTAVYTASYLCRYSYATVLPAMTEATGYSKTELSVAVTCLFVCYSVGQLVSGFLVDRLPPKILILAGMILSCAFNLAVPFCGSLWLVRVLWCLNGFAQAFFWPPIVALMSGAFSQDEYARGTAWVAYGGYIGTISLYLISPLLIRIWSWKALFIFSSSVGILIALLFAFRFPDIRIKKDAQELNQEPEADADPGTAQITDPCPKTGAVKRLSPISIISPALLLIMFSILIQGFIKDGITTWMPTYISEMFRLDSGISILSGVVLPVFAIVCLKLTSLLYTKKIRNPLVCAFALFGAGAVAALALFLTGGKVAALTVLFSALLTGAMHGANLMLICIVPSYFKDSGNVGFAAGLLNFTSYAGSSVSAYLLAAMSEHMDWRYIFAILALASLAAGAICFAVRKFRPKSAVSTGGETS